MGLISPAGENLLDVLEYQGHQSARRFINTLMRGRLDQSKEQWLCFAGAAMKRYPTPKVRETQVRW